MVSAGNPSVAPATAWDRLSQLATRALMASLVVFHVGLLLVHAVEGRLFEPAVSVRWFVGALLFAGFVALRRLDVPVLWGRKAVVLWLLVVLLHCHAAFSSADADEPVFDPMVATLVTEVFVAAATLLAALLAATGRFHVAAPRPQWHDLTAGVPSLAMAAGFGSTHGARPPPAC